jgi:hypothetical protein
MDDDEYVFYSITKINNIYLMNIYYFYYVLFFLLNLNILFYFVKNVLCFFSKMVYTLVIIFSS